MKVYSEQDCGCLVDDDVGGLIPCVDHSHIELTEAETNERD